MSIFQKDFSLSSAQSVINSCDLSIGFTSKFINNLWPIICCLQPVHFIASNLVQQNACLNIKVKLKHNEFYYLYLANRYQSFFLPQ